MSAIIPFVFKHDKEQTPIRTVLADSDPWFVAVDPCRVLGLGNTTKALLALDEDEKGLTIIQTLGGPQEMNIISEAGLYKLIQGSRKPAAKAFDRFVRHQILPSIRRTGRYESGSTACEPDLLAAIDAVQAELRAGFDEMAVRINKRADFPVSVVRYVGEGIAKNEKCKCIYCRNVDVVTEYGKKLSSGHEHHVDGNRANKSPENCTIPCLGCHKRLTNKSRPDCFSEYEALQIAKEFHRKLKLDARQIRAPNLASRFWDFRAAIQVDMGFPKMAKREG